MVDSNWDSEDSSARRFFERAIHQPDPFVRTNGHGLWRRRLARRLISIALRRGEYSSRMIVFTMRVTARPEKRREMLQALRSLLGPMSVQPGCLGCRLYQDADDEDAITWIEEWDSREQLGRHVRSYEYWTLLSVMDLSAVQPEVRFDTVVETAGMELIEDMMKREQAS